MPMPRREAAGPGCALPMATVRAQLQQMDPAEQDALRRYAHALSQQKAQVPRHPAEPSRSGGLPQEVSPGRLLWISHLCLLGLACAAMLACSVYLSFILVPLAVSYFLTFLLQPVVRLLTQRPLVCCGRPVCADLMRRNMLRANRDRLESTAIDPASQSSAKALGAAAKQCGLDLILLGRLPHTAAVLLTLALALGAVYVVTMLLVVDIVDAWNQAPAHYLAVAENSDIGDVRQSGTGGSTNMWEQDLYEAATFWHHAAVETIEADSGLRLTFQLDDLAEGIGYNRTVGWSLDSLQQGASLLTTIVNYVFIVLLLATYLLVGGGAASGPSRQHQQGSTAEQQHGRRPADAVGSTSISATGAAADLGRTDIAELVQQTLRDYVSRRATSALLIGFGSWFILQHVCGVLLAFLWGFLIFLLAFVPFIGPAISCLLPMPFILLDRSITRQAMWTAALAPPLLHVVANRVLEPAFLSQLTQSQSRGATTQPRSCVKRRRLDDVHPVVSLVTGARWHIEKHARLRPLLIAHVYYYNNSTVRTPQSIQLLH